MKLIKKSLFSSFVLFIFSISSFSQLPQKVANWSLKWNENFTNNKTLLTDWLIDNNSPSIIESSRWSSNISVKNGKLYILNKKENKGGKQWTSGSMQTRRTFKYGYFECRMKIAKATGINNSFWLYCAVPDKNEHKFEIDVVEAHYPNQIFSNVHDNGTPGQNLNSQKSFAIKKNLDDGFHIYGLLWTKDTLMFYLDGIPVRTIANQCCNSPAHVVLGTAILKWAGAITDKIDGTNMVVDYIRYYQK